MAHKQPYYIGLMSGTSLDGIDAVRVHFQHDKVEVLQYASLAYPDSLRTAILSLLSPADNEIERIEQAASERNQLALKLVEELCADIDRKHVTAIADHGQTLRHFPNANPAYTLQMHRAAELAELTGIDCVVDFRSKDLAAGGQGAPLVPAFHQAFFASKEEYRIVVNIGGLANISLLAPGPDNTAVGFDTGPGNTLLDTWCQKHTGQVYDIDGAWATSGTINDILLADLLADAYFQQAPPKSTGREHFNMGWLQQKLDSNHHTALAPADVQATLAELTAQTITRGIQQLCALSGIPEDSLENIYICGGGAYNPYLMHLLATHGSATVHSSEELGIPPHLMEATAFAWLGQQAIEGQAVGLKRTTGARHNNILGVVYRA